MKNLEERKQQIHTDLQMWFMDNGLNIDTEGVERFIGIMNKQRLLYDIHMENTKRLLEESLWKTIRNM